MNGAAIDDETLTNAGERMIVGNMWGYWAHLSIYRFALPFAQGRRVLDAGSGSGYGSAYLARHGAQVLALEASPVAVEHSRHRYAGDTVTFEVADLNAKLSLGDGVFDLVFSSNVFEHVANVDGLTAECARVVAPDGVVVVAVPPICSAEALAADIDNQFHVHHIPPTAWAAKLARFFTDVRCFGHVGSGDFADDARQRAELALPPDRVTIRETDFAFPEMSAAELLARGGRDITAVFVCRGRRVPPAGETLAERTPAAWYEGGAAAQLIGRLRAELAASGSHPAKLAPAGNHAAELAAAHSRAAAALAAADQRAAALAARITALEGSTSWRVTAPLRKVVTALRGR